jgi:ABC-type Fe3+ transport system permease subunit
LPKKVGAAVLFETSLPGFLMETTWQGWLLMLGGTILAFFIASILTDRRSA